MNAKSSALLVSTFKQFLNNELFLIYQTMKFDLIATSNYFC